MIKDISTIKWKAIKDSGIEFVIFDKENTITLPKKREFGSPEVGKSFREAKDTFGESNILQCIPRSQSFNDFSVLYC